MKSLALAWASVLLGMALLGPTATAGEKALLHCFFFTPIAEATQAEWDAFYKATDELPAKIHGLNRVWIGKLTERAAVSQQVKLGREYGGCMEFTDEAALQRYATHPAHDAWVKAYEKVRIAGTTTFDIVGR
jgi:hypothetical protein